MRRAVVKEYKDDVLSTGNQVFDSMLSSGYGLGALVISLYEGLWLEMPLTSKTVKEKSS